MPLILYIAAIKWYTIPYKVEAQIHDSDVIL